MAKLRRDAVVTIGVLHQKGQSNTHIAKVLEVTEGTVRYHLRREHAVDGRKKPFLIEQQGLAEVCQAWWEHQVEILPDGRSPNAELLWQMLVDEHQYSGSAKSVRKYVRMRCSRPRLRPFRRIETPPGALAQSDWLEVLVDIGAGVETVYGFVMILAHSRKTALVWSCAMDQLNWHRVHNEAFHRLGGIPAVNRIDNLKTGVTHGAGPWGQINATYQAYAQLMGFHVDPHEPYAPHQKGKVERQVGWIKQLGFVGRRFEDLAQLQAYTDQTIIQQEATRLCPATGKTIAATWQQEQRLLRPLPALLPQPFDLIRTCQVHKDCTVRFEGRTYTVPFRYLQQRLEVRGCADVVQIVDPQLGQIVQEYPRQTDARILIDQTCYEGDATPTVARPTPLGKVSVALQQMMEHPPHVRAMDVYAQLAAVSR